MHGDRADGAYLAGFQALKQNRLEEAAEYRTAAAGDPDYEDVAARLGFGKTSPDENGSSCNAGRQERRPALTRAPGRNTARFRTYSNPEVRR